MPHSTYLRSDMGTASIEPAGAYVAGSMASLTYVYRCGKFGIDDTGILKVSFRATSDMAKPQFDKPAEANYTSVEASNGSELECRFDRVNIRPWQNTIFIRLKRGFLRAGDTITVRLGDRRSGAPGIRLQTNVEKTFEFKTFVDAFATYEFAEIEFSPVIELVPGLGVHWKAMVPTVVEAGAPFRLAIVVEDRWGNPADLGTRALRLAADAPIDGISAIVRTHAGQQALTIEGLSCNACGTTSIRVTEGDGALLCTSNPLTVVAPGSGPLAYWGDLHGQSEETCGTNSALEYFEYARDRAFIDIAGHQGNDFEITDAFWRELNELTRRFDKPGAFVAVPGYEWSGNTGMGGDRNVFFAHEGEAIRRSSHILLRDLADAGSDCHTARELFAALRGQDVVTVAHVGGRYADIRAAHDGHVERSVEVHSMWGTFEWLLHDAFQLGFRVGVVCNSDDHKGRQGASAPGASMFGALGGLTCFWMRELTRAALFDAMRRRHHYGTTGNRMHLEVEVELPEPADLYDDDPALGPASSKPVRKAVMGDIVRTRAPRVELRFHAIGSAPIERIDIFNGSRHLRTLRPFRSDGLGRRIRVMWEGAEYRGRGRQTVWDGGLRLTGNAIRDARAINFFNPDKPLRRPNDRELAWESVTTGNHAAVDVYLDEPDAGAIDIRTPLVTTRVDVAEIGLEDRVFEAGGLGRRLRVFRLADRNVHLDVRHRETIELAVSVDNPLYVRVTQEDGHQAWSSPIYLIG
jgi:hypothetical protein